MQPQFLRMFAPNSLHLLYRPLDTGNPGFDMGQHIALNSHHRIDLESTQLIGNRVIGHIEHALGPADEAEQQYRILTVPYAERQLGSTMDAAELIRVIKEAVSAGVESDPRSLQIWASWAYNECKTRPVPEVLKELAMMAMQMTGITTTKEEQLEDEPEVFEFHGPVHCFTDSDPTANKEERQREQRRLFEQRCDEILDQHETTAPFAAELRSITAKLPRHHSITNFRDEEAQFQEYLAGLVDQGDCNPEALQESHERVTEQYDEGGVVSLHMSESERFIVDGTLDDDVDSSYLPSDVAPLVDEMREMFTSGIPFSSNDPEKETIDAYLEFRLNQIYGDPSDERNRARRTMRGIGTSKNELFEYVYTVSAYPNREERQYVTEVLEQIMENMKRDYILNTMNRSATFRRFMIQIENATDPRELKLAIQEAYKARTAKTLNIKMFTALTTIYRVKLARLDSTPVRTEADGGKTYVRATPIIALSQIIPTKDLRQLAAQLHTLPALEREPVRNIFRRERSRLYNRIRDGLGHIVETASPRKLMYLRYALFEDPTTGKANEPQNMINLLCREDRTAIWKQLQEATKLSRPAAA